MAYGDGSRPEEVDYIEMLFRCEDLLEEWFGTFNRCVREPEGDDTVERLGLEWAERRLEEAAMELSLQLKARRLERQESTGLQKDEDRCR